MGKESFHCKEDNLSFTGRINLEVPFPGFPAVKSEGSLSRPLASPQWAWSVILLLRRVHCAMLHSYFKNSFPISIMWRNICMVLSW